MSASALPAPSPVQLLEDKEPSQLRVGRVNGATLIAFLCLLGGPTLLLFVLIPGYGLAVMLVGAVIQAQRLSRLEGEPQALRNARKHQVTTFGFIVVSALFVAWVAGWLFGDMLGRYGSDAIAFLVGVFFLLPLDTAPDMAQSPTAAKKVARAIVSLDHLRQRRNVIEAGVHELSTLEVFDADNTNLSDAWRRRSTDRIESALQKGDALTRKSWQRGIALFNVAVADVDLARGKLRYLLSQSEQALAPFNIDYASLDVRTSKTLEGYAPILTRQTFVTERLNYSQGIGSAAGNVALGRVPWQATLVVATGLLIWNLANRSKILRQLKEMEGKLVADAAAAKGDFTQFATILTTRVLPQFDALLEITGRLEIELAELRDAAKVDLQAADARTKAFQLACSLREAKMFLEMSAGN